MSMRQDRARSEFAAKVAKLLRLDDESATELTDAIEELIRETVLSNHENEYYHNQKPGYY